MSHPPTVSISPDFGRFFDMSVDMLCMANLEGYFLNLNSVWAKTLGFTLEELTSRPYFDFVHPDDVARTHTEAARLATGTHETVGFENRYLCKDGSYRWLQWSCSVRQDSQLIYGVVRDITGRIQAEEALRQANERLAASLQEKNVLLQEVHHRVKNNLQVVSSLLSLQAHQSQDPQVRAVLRDSQSRVSAMALIHQKLYQSPDLGRIDFAAYVTSLTSAIFSTYEVHSGAVDLVVDVIDIPLSVDTAVVCGLILNELVTNALKHGFTGGRRGTLRVGLREQAEGALMLVVADDGRGLPECLDPRSGGSLGLQLVRGLADQLEARLDVSSTSGQGTTFTLCFRSKSPGA